MYGPHVFQQQAMSSLRQNKTRQLPGPVQPRTELMQGFHNHQAAPLRSLGATRMLLNFALFQCCWLACVLSGAAGWSAILPCLIWLASRLDGFGSAQGSGGTERPAEAAGVG
jgi:hypothetical protein